MLSLPPASSDYTSVSMDLTFNSGTTTQTVMIPIIGDNVVESTESFTVSLTSADSAVTLNPSTTTVTILDDDDDSKFWCMEQRWEKVSIHMCIMLLLGLVPTLMSLIPVVHVQRSWHSTRKSWQSLSLSALQVLKIARNRGRAFIRDELNSQANITSHFWLKVVCKNGGLFSGEYGTCLCTVHTVID